MPDKTGIGTLINDEFELGSSGLDLFSVPKPDNTIIHGKSVTFYPLNALNNQGPYEFIIPNDGNDFTELPYTRFEGSFQITKPDGTALADTDLLAHCNMFPHALFRQIECELNNTEICDLSTPTYPYKAYIETHLSYSKGAKDTQLELELYTKDIAGEEETFTLANANFLAKHSLLKKGKIHFSSKLHIDFFHSQRFLVPGVSIKLKFIRNDENFIINGAGNCKITLHDLKVIVRRVTLDPAICEGIERGMQRSAAIYPIVQSKIKNYTIAAGVKNERITQIFRGKLPRSLMFGFLSTRAFDGDKAKNPFKFHNSNINYLNIYINGEPFVPNVFKPDFSTNDYIREYRWFLDNIGIAHDNESNDISLKDFKNNSCFFAFDFSPDLCNNYHIHTPPQGTIDLSVGFKDNTTENITCLVYASFNEAVTIDKDRNVNITT